VDWFWVNGGFHLFIWRGRSGVSHGVFGLIKVKGPTGNLVNAGRRMIEVTGQKILALDIDVMPLHPETARLKAGAAVELRTAVRGVFAGRLLLRRVDSSPARIKTHHERPQIMLQ
jgi:hypothetical protein